MSSTDPDPEIPRRLRRRDAARSLMRPEVLGESLTVARPPVLKPSVLAGVQAALVAAIALPVVHLSPWPHLIGYAALGALAALFGRFAPPGRRNRVVFAAGLTLTAAVLIMSLASWFALPAPVQLGLLAGICGLCYFLVATRRWGPPGALIFVFAAGAAMGPVESLEAVWRRIAAVAAVALLAWLICAATEPLRHRPGRDKALPVEPLQPLRDRLTAAGRIILGAAAALFAARWLGAEHPSWAALGALAVMQGAHLHIHVSRALQRMGGTVVGAVLAGVLISLHPSVWMVIALVCLMQCLTEVVIGFNYALGQVFVTPMALLMSYMASQGALDALIAGERVLDTLLGAVIGLILSVALSSLDQRAHLARRQAERAGGG